MRSIADRPPTNVELFVAEVTDRFIGEVQQGLSPSIDEYADEYPEIADTIRQVFPALALLDTSQPTVQPGSHDGGAVTGQLGDYRIHREIGRGGMGVVYEAEQISLGRRVALKVLPFAAVLDPKQLQRFKNEAQAAAHLKHPHIVGVYSVGCERGVHYYAMEFIEGANLAELAEQLREPIEPGADDSSGSIRRMACDLTTGRLGAAAPTPRCDAPTGSFPTAVPPVADGENEVPTDVEKVLSLSSGSTQSREFFHSVTRLGIQAAEALEHAHQLGVVHRDIKPSNLMVDSRGHLWVTDFGLALTSTNGNLTMTGDVVGTLRYMSPEQVSGRRTRLDYHTDVYSLGISLWELLTLSPVYPQEDRQQLMRQILEEEPRPPHQLNRAIPKDLETIVLKATAKEPQARYGTAQEMADDLRRFLEDRPIQAKRPGLVRRLGKWTRRHKTLTATGLVAVLLALLTGAGFAIRNAQAVREAERLADEAFAGALTAIEAEDYTLAKGKLGEAQTHIAQQPGADPDLSDKIRRLRMELEQFQSLIELVDQPKHHHYPSKPEWVEGQWVGPAREALAQYGVLSDPQWTSRLEQSLLPAERRSDIRKAAYRLLVLLAYHERERLEEVGEEVAARQALEYLQQASTFHSPTRVCYYLRGKAHRLLGEDEAAQAADSLAEKTPATIALDHFIPGREANDEEEAARQFQAALRIEPDHYSSLFYLGLQLRDLGRHEAALMAYYGCTAARPDDGLAYLDRIRIYMEIGQEDNAEAEAEMMVRLLRRPFPGIEGWKVVTMEYEDNEQYKSALAAVNRIIEILEGLDPDSPEVRGEKSRAHHRRGGVYSGIGELDKAIRDYTIAIRFWPENHSAYHNRAVAYRDKGALDKALVDFGKAIQLDPENAVTYSARGQAYINKGEYNLAIADCTEAIRLDPNFAAAYANRGMAYRKIGEPDKAIADHSNAIRLDPKRATAYSNRASAYIDKGEHNLAIADCTEAIRLEPELAAAYNNRGRAHMHRGLAHGENGDFDLAIADYSNAIRLDPKSAMAYSNRSYAYAAKGAYNLAIADCTEAIRLDADYPTPYYNRGRQFYRRGELDKALADLNKGIQLDSNCGAAFDDRGHVYLLQGELDKAIADHTKAIELDQNAAAYHNRALVYTDKGELDKALADFDKGIQHDPEDPFTIAHRAMLHQDRGEVEKAVTDIRRAMELRPDAYASYVHAHILLSDGNVDEYRRACATMLDQFGDTTIPQAAYFVVWTCALVPDAVEDPSRVVELAEMAVGAAPKKNSYVTALGAALCRAGQYEEAIQRLSTAATEYENRSDMKSRSGLAYTWFGLAIANERLGHHGEAEQWFGEAAGLTERLMAEHENGTNHLVWNRRLTMRLFREEAAGLIGMKDEG